MPLDFLKKPSPTGDYIDSAIAKVMHLQQHNLLQHAQSLQAKNGRNNFEIGLVLSVVLEKKWYGPHKNFAEWTLAELGLHSDKAYALIRISDAVVTSGVTGAQVDAIGWTKFERIARVITKDAPFWLEQAKTLNRKDLEHLVRQHLSPEKKTVAPTKRQVAQKQVAFAGIKSPMESVFDTGFNETGMQDSEYEQDLIAMSPDDLIPLLAKVLKHFDNSVGNHIWQSVRKLNSYPPF